MQVYIVMQSGGGADIVVRVFRSLDSAMSCVDKLKTHPSNKYLRFWIDSNSVLED